MLIFLSEVDTCLGVAASVRVTCSNRNHAWCLFGTTALTTLSLLQVWNRSVSISGWISTYYIVISPIMTDMKPSLVCPKKCAGLYRYFKQSAAHIGMLLLFTRLSMLSEIEPLIPNHSRKVSVERLKLACFSTAWFLLTLVLLPPHHCQHQWTWVSLLVRIV